jgi:hypothetical protein
MYFHLSNIVGCWIPIIIGRLAYWSLPPTILNHVDDLDVRVGVSNNDLDLGVQMARALDEAWKTCDVVIKDSF